MLPFIDLHCLVSFFLNAGFVQKLNLNISPSLYQICEEAPIVIPQWRGEGGGVIKSLFLPSGYICRGDNVISSINITCTFQIHW